MRGFRQRLFFEDIDTSQVETTALRLHFGPSSSTCHCPVTLSCHCWQRQPHGAPGHVGHASQTWLTFVLPFLEQRIPCCSYLFCPEWKLLWDYLFYCSQVVPIMSVSHRVGVFSLFRWCVCWCYCDFFARSSALASTHLAVDVEQPENTDCSALQIRNMFKIWWHVGDVRNYVDIIYYRYYT